MTIEQERSDKSTMVLTLLGRLDTANAPLLERKILQCGEEISHLILDFAGLDYISSMGLRVLLQAQKSFKERQGRLTIKNMCASVRAVFEMTGFLSLMVQEEKFVVIRKDEPDGIVLSLNGDLKLENIPMVLAELSNIKKQKSYKPITKELVMSDELNKVLDNGGIAAGPVTVILDMEKLTDFAPVAIKHLSQAIADTAWEGRNLSVKNAPPRIQALFKGEELGELLEIEGQ